MRYNEILTELFNKSADMHFTATDDDLYLANFEVGDGIFTIRAYWRDLLKCWEIEFKRNGDYVATNTGGQFEVFATALEFINKFIARYNPEKFRFGANVDEPSRVKLYDRMARSVGNNPNYEMSIVPRAQYKYYVFTKKAASSEDLDETQVVNELFDKAAPYTLSHTKEDGLSATFSIGKNHYRIYAAYWPGSKTWEVAFTNNGEYEMTGTGHEFEVFATVKAFISEFITIEQPDMFKFSANDDEASRVKLYDRMSKQLASTFNYQLEVRPMLTKHLYTFTRISK